MKRNQLHLILIVLLASFLVANCGCRKGPGNSQSSTKKKEEQKRKQQEELTNLVNKEKDLEKKAKDTLEQLKQIKGPIEPIFTSMYVRLDDEIEAAKNDPKEADKIVTDKQRLKNELESTKLELEKAAREERSPNLNPQELHPKINELGILVDKFYKTIIKQTINSDGSINRNKLSGSDKIFYDYLLAKYPLGELAAEEGPQAFAYFAMLEGIEELTKATSTSLLFFQNIQRQHELKKQNN
jgi:predicted small secreted protein